MISSDSGIISACPDDTDCVTSTEKVSLTELEKKDSSPTMEAMAYKWKLKQSEQVPVEVLLDFLTMNSK